MFTRHNSAKPTKPRVTITKEEIDAAERFQECLRQQYEIALQSMREDVEIGAFYLSGQTMIRISKIEMVPTSGALMLTGVEESGRPVVVAGYFKSMDVMFRRVELSKDAARTSLEFHIRSRHEAVAGLS